MPPADWIWSGAAAVLAAATAIAIAGAALGIWLTGLPRAARQTVPFSGGVLIGVVVFGLLPELAEGLGWRGGLAILAAGFILLAAINQYVYPVCPTCSHTHDHSVCATELHGFATPLVVAAVLHSFLDGWSIAAAAAGGGRLETAVAVAVLLHKIPEGVAFGIILRAALRSRWSALGWCAAVQVPTLAGGLIEALVAPQLGSGWIGYPLALTGGSFLYLGLHAVHAEWKRYGPVPAFMPALTGAAGAAALQQGLRVLMR